MTPKRRIRALLASSWLILAGLGTRLYALQVVKHEELARRAEQQVRRVDWRAPRRGRILDRQGRVLAVDRPAMDVVVDLPELDPSIELVRALGNATRFPKPQKKDMAPVYAWVAARMKEARDRIRSGASVAEVAFAPDKDAKARVERLARRFPGLVTSPVKGGFTVLAPASLLGVRDRALGELAQALDTDLDSIRDLVQAREDEVRAIKRADKRREAWGKPIAIARDVSFDTAARVEEASVAVPGIGTVARFERRYPRGELAAHLLGYTTPLHDEELTEERAAGRLVDEVPDGGGLLSGTNRDLPEGARVREQTRGRTGLEAQLDEELAGSPGARVVERHADRSRETLVDLPARDGDDVKTTIDAVAQGEIEAALDEAVKAHGAPGAGGAAALIALDSGDVIALASSPRFDPNTLHRDFDTLSQSPAKPLLHRGAAAVPPGSTFKVLSSFAFLGAGGLDPATQFPCRHALVPGKKGFHCDDDHGEHVGLEPAIACSCNVFFFHAADAMGAAPLEVWADRVGFGRALSSWFPLGRGRFPDREWKTRRLEQAEESREARARDLEHALEGLCINDRPGLRLIAVDVARARFARAVAWRDACARDTSYGPGDLRNAAIGQGDVKATPLQVARLAALVALGGRVPRTRLVSTDERGSDAIALDARVLQIVRRGLEGCVERGTASAPAIGLHGLDVAGKTGTAERGQDKPNYAWFMGYYPASRPEVAFACLVDTTSGHGGDVCGPIARKIIDAYARSHGEEPKRR